MGEFQLGIQASEISFEDLTEDIKGILSEPIMSKVANSVYGDMRDALKRHVESDVYDKSLYKPKVYKRRSEAEGRGTPLNDIEGNAFPIIRTIPGAAEIGINYMPTGEHKNEKWHTADGNELIGRIEKKNPPYTWEPKTGPQIPERPFWQKFVDEMIDTGFGDSVSRAFAAVGIEVDDIQAERQDEDGNY